MPVPPVCETSAKAGPSPRWRADVNWSSVTPVLSFRNWAWWTSRPVLRITSVTRPPGMESGNVKLYSVASKLTTRPATGLGDAAAAGLGDGEAAGDAAGLGL